MSTRKTALLLSTALLLLGAPGSYALAGQDGPGRPDKPAHECSDGLDNDQDGTVDVGADPDCGSAKDNSEAAEVEDPAPGPGTVLDPVAELVGTVEEALPEDPLAPVVAVVDEVVGQLPPPPAP